MKHHHRRLERLVGLVALAFLAVGLLLPSSSTALTTDFYCITYNNPTDCDSAEAPFQIQITDRGRKSIGQRFRATFSLDTDTPVQPMGVNPGESLGTVLDLQPGATYSDILSKLNSGKRRVRLHVQGKRRVRLHVQGKRRVRLHVQGFDGGGSESLINPVPEPSTALLLCIGLIGLTGSRCRPKTTLRPRSSILSD